MNAEPPSDKGATDNPAEPEIKWFWVWFQMIRIILEILGLMLVIDVLFALLGPTGLPLPFSPRF